jgi:hypothetical protein
MSPLELRQTLHAQLDRIPEVQLPEIQQYLISLADVPTPSPTTGASLLTALKTMGTWQGDGFEDCLQAVYDSRSRNSAFSAPPAATTHSPNPSHALESNDILT